MRTKLSIPRGGCPCERNWRSLGFWQNLKSPGNCQIRVPTGPHGYQNVQNFGANNFGFHPKSGHSRIVGTFFEKKNKLGKIGSHGPQLGQCSPIGKNMFEKKVLQILKCQLWGQTPKLFAPKFCTFWYPYRPVGTLIRQFPGLLNFCQILEIANSVRTGNPGMPVATGWKSGQNHDPDFGCSIHCWESGNRHVFSF